MNDTRRGTTRRTRVTRLLATALAVLSLAGAAAALLQLGVGGEHAARAAEDPPSAGTEDDEGKAEQLYTCGMHPSVVQRGPGTCPICGMDLTPTRRHRGAGGQGSGSSAAPEGTVTIDPVVVQNMGVRVARVKRAELARSVRTLGEVVVAEDLVSVVNLRFSGWIERLHVDETGVKVRRGQPLFSVYSPELVSAQEEYLLAVRSAGKDSPLARSALRRLTLWDLSETTLRRIVAGGAAQRTLTIRSPRSGYVLHKSVVQGAKANAGVDLFRIGKLDAIWVHARVYEHDAPWIRLGQEAAMELSFEQGRQYRGKVSYIYPTLDEKTRTLKVRLEFVNPALQLKPGMFATVRIETRHKAGALVVPTEAILRSGERNVVFVARGGGRYEPRQVVTGLSGDGHLTEVLSGLKKGERVVVSGQFLLDSESQLQEAMQKMLAARLQANQSESEDIEPSRQPEDRRETTGEGSGDKVGDKVVWTCPMHPRIVEDEPGRCPICGMDLVSKKVSGPKSAASDHDTHQHGSEAE